ncbi:OmpA family protein [Pelagibacteraceae bacterium]|nr:OmpA family protein [Pelagibacteraceae bacterium]
MKKIINIYFLLIFAFIGVGCSSFSEKIDIASIIDRSENWLFSEEGNTSEDEEEIIYKSSNEEKNEEEVFPDIADIPQDRPNFEELDKNFFEEDEVTKAEELLTSSNEDSLINSEIEPEENLSVVKKNILAILKIRESVRLNVVKLLINSDPLVDNTASFIKEKDIIELGDKKAIIQFPDNSVIPDQSAYEVIGQIIKIIGIDKNIKLIGHASRSGSNNIIGKRKNMEISIARADTIKNIFINKGFQADRLITSGKGDLEPLHNESKIYGEAVNRRVEIFFISK